MEVEVNCRDLMLGTVSFDGIALEFVLDLERSSAISDAGGRYLDHCVNIRVRNSPVSRLLISSQDAGNFKYFLQRVRVAISSQSTDLDGKSVPEELRRAKQLYYEDDDANAGRSLELISKFVVAESYLGRIFVVPRNGACEVFVEEIDEDTSRVFSEKVEGGRFADGVSEVFDFFDRAVSLRVNPEEP
ncbi:hypothetical protein [Nitrogeniibacter aestuarii]|uniref:hypothetical protein n=1 Tax=Nitrogeniibacter aestuarii TaxID=2815343 RepID=UPI001E419E2E|nr:hypothetical protein [Nitrogeniibacter aestuarii]